MNEALSLKTPPTNASLFSVTFWGTSLVLLFISLMFAMWTMEDGTNLNKALAALLVLTAVGVIGRNDLARKAMLGAAIAIPVAWSIGSGDWSELWNLMWTLPLFGGLAYAPAIAFEEYGLESEFGYDLNDEARDLFAMGIFAITTSLFFILAPIMDIGIDGYLGDGYIDETDDDGNDTGVDLEVSATAFYYTVASAVFGAVGMYLVISMKKASGALVAVGGGWMMDMLVWKEIEGAAWSFDPGDIIFLLAILLVLYTPLLARKETFSQW